MQLCINGKEYSIRPYACSPSSEFPFYINVTNICNAKCKFCSNEINGDKGKLDLKELESILGEAHNKVSRFSISGGEPLLLGHDLRGLLDLLKKYDRRITINTNGSLLEKHINILNDYNIESIQLSRHHYDDKKNNEVFGIETISYDDMKKLNSRADLRINCLLIKNYIDSSNEVIKFLEHISETNISQVGFISMMKVNSFTEENFVDYRDFLEDLKMEMLTTRKMCDDNRCICDNCIYIANNGRSIFVYFRNTENYKEGGRSLFFDSTGLKEGY